MTPQQLIDLAKRKNEAHKLFLQARGAFRRPGVGSEKDRDVAMDHATREERENYENLCDEWAVRMVEYQMNASGAIPTAD
jgi:hypothetical protein